jgi:hypothetical protein
MLLRLKKGAYMKRREFMKKLTVAGASLRLLWISSVMLGSAALEGCISMAELSLWVGTGLEAFAGIVSIINPPAGSVLAIAVTTAEGLWKAVSAAITEYNDPSLPKSTTFQKVIAALTALQDGLQGVLDAIPVSIPAAVLIGIKAGLALLIATLNHFATHLPVPTGAQKPAPIKTAALSPLQQRRIVTAASVQPATSKSDFVKKFNALKLAKADGTPVMVKP